MSPCACGMALLLHKGEHVHAPMRSTCCGVAHSAVKVSSGTSPATGRKLKMPPPPLLIRTT